MKTEPDLPLKPAPLVSRYATTLIAISAKASCGVRLSVAAVWTFVFCLEHSGQRMPTGVAVMQSGQIGRPQFAHETRVSRLVWR